jgi:DNA-binding NtrC family response regulator
VIDTNEHDDHEGTMKDTQSMGRGRRSSSLVVALKRTTTGEIFELDGARRWVVGSNSSNDLVFDDPYLSNVHCVLERKPNGALIVRDSGSRNGTFIDGNQVQAAELRIGAFLTVGRTTLVALAAALDEDRPAIELLRGRDPSLRLTIDQAITAARTDCSVLVLGETGTGKDLLARVIHESSRRAEGPFVAVNCGSIARELVASELFGHEKGAFTGASDARDGWFVEAQGGTLFLDEIGELPLELQPHLLRVLETRRVRRVGGTADRPIDVRIVAATHRTAGLGSEGSSLRPDLYHRLATVVLALTPLRERMSDLGELVEGMLDDLAPEHGRKTVTADGWQALASYGWPGNIRELFKAAQRAVTLGGDELGPLDFFPSFGQHAHRRHLQATPPTPFAAGAGVTGELDALQPYHAALRGAMEQALATHGTIRAAASAIGMPKSTFADKARAWGLFPRRKVRIHQPENRKKK